VQVRHAGIKPRDSGNEKRGEWYLPPRSREWFLLIDADLKGLEKENPKGRISVSCRAKRAAQESQRDSASKPRVARAAL
jgi:hypothetical protein